MNADDAALLTMIAPVNGVVSAERVASSGIPVLELMRRLLPWAADHADPPISKQFVGAIAQGASGALYAGMNLEFPGESLAHTIHAEGAAFNNAWLHDEDGVVAIAITHVPCGYCRHYMREFVAPEKLVLAMPERNATLAEALPFCPAIATDADPFHVHAPVMLAEPAADPLVTAAIGAASRSYAPYSKSRGGLGLGMLDGTIVTGRYAENSAFNPIMPALQSALIAARLAGYAPASIARAVLVETPGMASQRGAATSVLATFSTVKLEYALAR